MRSAFGIAADFISLDWIEPRPILSNSCIPIKSCFWDWLNPRPQPSHVNHCESWNLWRHAKNMLDKCQYVYRYIYTYLYFIYFYIIIVLESRKFKSVDDFFVFMLQYNSIICLKKRNASYVVCRSIPYRYITPWMCFVLNQTASSLGFLS